MSIATMARVWADSQHTGTNLLMLLAIADFSDDDGKAYPAVAKLATKCRMSKRNAQDRLRELADSGELTVLKNQGPPPKFPNLFRINLNRLGVKHTAPVKPTAPVQFDVERGAAHCAPGVQPTAPKPPSKHQEPPRDDRAELFEVFWRAYPLKVGKDAARKAFHKRKTDKALLSEMLAAIDVQKQSDKWVKDGGQYIPHPTTWLNQGRWMDEHEDAATSIGSLLAGGL